MTDHTTQLAQEAAKELSRLITETTETPILLLFSGGSALEIVKHLPADIFHKNVTATVLDERYTFNEADSNFAALLQTDLFLQDAIYTIDPRPHKDESLKETAARFERSLRIWRKENVHGKVFITQGIGEDGHTSGILPFPEDAERFRELFESESWVTGYEISPEKNPHTKRITTTLTFFREEVSASIVFATGENKRDALTRALTPEGDLSHTPAHIIHEMPDVTILTDIKGLT